MKVLFSHWMRELDWAAINRSGIPSIVLMENASRGSANICRNNFPVKHFPNSLIFIGPGNNGGDGIATGRILAQWGYDPLFLFMTDPEKLTGDPLINFNIIKNLGMSYALLKSANDLKQLIKKYANKDTFFVDALFGTGIKGPVKEGLYFNVIKIINNSDFNIVSIDIPSGLSDQFSHDKGISIEPDITITFQTLKVSHLFPDDKKRCGQVYVIDIGIPEKHLKKNKYFIELAEPGQFSNILKKRESGIHKGKLGHSLIIAGSEEKPGAAILSSIAVLKSGAGLSTCATSENNKDLIMKSYPEIMTLSVEKLEDLKTIPKEYNSILAGPGLGIGEKTVSLINKVLGNSRVPVILDADALNILEDKIDILGTRRNFPLILTPHPREFSRISGLDMPEILNNPISSARNFSMKHDLYTILKGHYTVISSPKGDISINQTGNPGMATAGSGDVLGGIISGMISQFQHDFPIYSILQFAVFIHGLAGDIAASKKGESPMIASDIIDNITEAFKRKDEFNSEFIFS